MEENFNRLVSLATQITNEWDEYLPSLPSEKEWQDSLQGASEDLVTAIAFMRHLAVAYHNCGFIFHQLGLFDLAVESYNTAI